MDPYAPELLVMVVIGFVIAFVLAFGIGANDVANSFGTSVGSGVLTIKQACVLATICEISGSVLIGYKVSDTMRKGILEVTMYQGSEKELMLGCISALSGSAIWLLVATFLKLPISGTHSIVGSSIGFSLVARGTQGLKWDKLAQIVVSWFLSPIMSGFVSFSLYFGIRRFILHAVEPLKAGFRALPLFYGVTFFINLISIVLDAPKLLYLDNVPTWLTLASSVVLGILVALLTHFVIVPMHKRKISKRLRHADPVKFSFEDSVESSPSGSPKKTRRPISLVSEGKPLPAIAEITELVSLSDSSPKTFKISPYNVQTIPAQPSYKIDPDIIKKAEVLLGKTSLDNIDLTITSLNYIDEQQQQQQNGGTVTTTSIVNERSQLCEQQLRAATPEANQSMDELDETLKKDKLTVGGSGASLEMMVSTILSTNSSKLPLIGSKDTISEFKPTKTPLEDTEETEEISMLFSFLQILTATFGSFAHGGNDVSNAIGPLIALYMIYREGSVLQQAESPIYILIYGGVGISIGLWLWGRRVIETIGNDLTNITSSTGFAIEIGASFTVLLASKVGLPISTTHCKVGSVVCVGHFSSTGQQKQTKPKASGSKAALAEQAAAKEPPTEAPAKSAVDWHLFRNIAFAWIVTVPVTMFLSAVIMFCLTQLLL